MDWYYADSGRQIGPYSDEAFRQLVSEGHVTASALVWHEGMTNWQPLSEVSGQLSIAAGAEGGEHLAVHDFCSQCGRQFTTEDMITYEGAWVCAGCKDLFFQRLREGVPLPAVASTVRYAGFWIRFAAAMIDGIIMWFVQMLLAMVLLPVMGRSNSGIALVLPIVQHVINLAYVVFFLGRFGATPGKMACQIKVIVSDGGRVSYLRALGRYFAKLLSTIILCIGYIMAAFDSEKRALHDHICNTRVIWK